LLVVVVAVVVCIQGVLSMVLAVEVALVAFEQMFQDIRWPVRLSRFLLITSQLQLEQVAQEKVQQELL
jgi:hypothetical protein